MRLVDDQQRAVLAGEVAQCRVIAIIRQHHADVGHDRLGQHAGDVPVRQRFLQCGDIVELDHLGELREVAHLADEGRIGMGRAAVDGHVCLIHRAMVAVVEDEDFLAASDGAAPLDDGAVGVRRGRRHLPAREPEAVFQQLADDRCIGRGHHGGEAVSSFALQGLHHGRRRVAEHGAGVAKAKIDVVVAIGVGYVNALRLGDEQREWRAPVHHPVHGNTLQPVPGRIFRELFRSRVALGEEGLFAAQHGLYRLLRNVPRHDILYGY